MLPPENARRPAATNRAARAPHVIMSHEDKDDQALAPDPAFESLIRHIQESRGIDFRGYKRTSLRRRINLRMQEVAAADYDAYQSFLEAHPQEFVELLNTVLINVTSFFRDPDAWDVLRDEVIPAIIARTDARESIRVWSVGCASGQEPYSVAMLFADALGVAEFCRRVKIYATDLDEAALEAARRASYAPREVESVSAELLERYFERAGDHYVFQRELRKCVIFGRHNVVFDAPISRLDLVLCRNLMIYLESDTQNLVLPRLHYALADDGYLFLGKAETQLARSKLFKPVDTRHRIFRKSAQEWRRSRGGSLVQQQADLRDSSALQVHMRMLEAIIDATQNAQLVVDLLGVLIFANAAARRLLDVGESDIGRPFQDLPISYRPSELRSRIDEVQRELRPVRIEHQEYLRAGAEPMRLTIDLAPLPGYDGQAFAVLLTFSDSTRAYQLQQELEAAQESLETMIEELQSANEELETTNEELQSTNEELETTNEELQSTNEELETMNEELRSTNEELEATNEELRRQTDDAAQYRGYSEAVLRSANAGIVVVDTELHVRSWNRWSENTWGLRADEVTGQNFFALDVGLPVAKLRDAVRDVLDHSEPHGHVVLDGVDRRGRDQRWAVRVSPLLYHDRSHRGAVLLIEDMTDTQKHDEHSRRLGRILGDSLNEIYFLDPATLRFTLANRGAEEKLGLGIADLRQHSLADFMPGVPLQALRAMVTPLLSGESREQVFETTLRGRDGREYPSEICLQYFAHEVPPILVAIVHDTSRRQALDAASS
jgi:two-component system CheB/CheR fusion protein